MEKNDRFSSSSLAVLFAGQLLYRLLGNLTFLTFKTPIARSILELLLLMGTTSISVAYLDNS